MGKKATFFSYLSLVLGQMMQSENSEYCPLIQNIADLQVLKEYT